MNAPHVVGAPYPLYWPEHTPRARNRRKSKYKVQSLGAPRDAILRRLRRMGARNIVISSNVPLRTDGLPLSGGRDNLPDPGVAVYFSRTSGGVVRDIALACDHWISVSENCHAIHLTLEALAAIERSGSAQMMDAAFSGFARLPAQAGPTVSHWTVVLGITEPTTNLGVAQRIGLRDRVEHRYRELARKVHPDAPGGSHAGMLELNRAIEEARKELAT